jgi:uncharacterized membrane protein
MGKVADDRPTIVRQRRKVLGQMGAFELSIVIDRPIEEVFAVLANLENDVKWRREWVETTNTSEGALGVGATFRLVGEFLGRRIATEYEMTKYEPNRITAWKTVSGPLPLTFQRTFEHVEGGTRVNIRYDAELRGLLKLFEPLFASMGKRQLEGDFPKLREMLEARAV